MAFLCRFCRPRRTELPSGNDFPAPGVRVRRKYVPQQQQRLGLCCSCLCLCIWPCGRVLGSFLGVGACGVITQHSSQLPAQDQDEHEQDEQEQGEHDQGEQEQGEQE